MAKPTSASSTKFAKITRYRELFNTALAIHGGTVEDKTPALYGLVDTLTSKFKVDTVEDQIINSKAKKTLAQKAEQVSKSEYEKSEENLIRSLNVYYSHNVMGKQKYKKMRLANKNKNIPNFVPLEEHFQKNSGN